MARFFEAKNSKRSSYRANNSASPTREIQRVAALSITRLSDDGRGVGSYKGKTVFISNALPGEVLSADISFGKSHYGEGLATAIVQKSDSRRLPLCGYFDRCGGCHLQHLEFEEQKSLKLNNVLNKLNHVAHITPETTLPVISGSEYHYRQRARLSVIYTQQDIVIGFRKKSSKEIIDIKHCHVMLAEFNQLIAPLREWLSKHRPSVTHIELAGGSKSIGIVLRHTKSIDLPLRKKLGEKLSQYKVKCWFQEKKAGELTDINGLSTASELTYTLPINLGDITKDVSFLYHPQDFIQTNALVNHKMVNQAINLLEPNKNQTILDLFCGIGNFSLPLSLFVGKVIGVEGSKNMVDKAIKNASLNNCKNTTFESADLFNETVVNNLFKKLHAQKPESILLDPPRAGAKTICQNIKAISPDKIAYISCEPNTFARDAKLLVDNGYQLKKFGTMDMFPQTYHNEIISLFVLKIKQNATSMKREFN